jgi:hypothetical protein
MYFFITPILKIIQHIVGATVVLRNGEASYALTNHSFAFKDYLNWYKDAMYRIYVDYQ